MYTTVFLGRATLKKAYSGLPLNENDIDALRAAKDVAGGLDVAGLEDLGIGTRSTDSAVQRLPEHGVIVNDQDLRHVGPPLARLTYCEPQNAIDRNFKSRAGFRERAPPHRLNARL